MLRCVLLRPASAVLLGLFLSGCGFNFLDEGREAWRDKAERACFREGRVIPSAFQQPGREIDGRGACGIEQPLKVSAFDGGRINLSSTYPLGCNITATTEAWLTNSVQPAALAWFGEPVIEVLSMGSYSCRPINHRRGAELSEHAFGNAIDVAGFKFASGRIVRVKTHWRRGAPEEQAFLRTVAAAACGPFTTVLGPGSNRLHEDHLHLDLARRGKTGRSVYCSPRLTPPAMPAPGLMVSLPPAEPMPAPQSLAERSMLYGYPNGETPAEEEGIAGTDDVLYGATPAAPAAALPPPPMPARQADERWLPPARVPLSYSE
ncbi:extensin family protein [Prosthecomicrobium pneumaticum]|uniref:Extensin-like C-terminal domain-containing protein n=1 Tax=Prosthecomicrobium pneumaticum TaxID=81895 RepID=A0A7W9FLR1_9HYPH|nr:extensin family protein [Prosthecomicrobium pneumaticum]MBB5753000.1 hypothetical protein [Prosthecomicrobium pneumaticum]